MFAFDLFRASGERNFLVSVITLKSLENNRRDTYQLLRRLEH